ncbi:Bromodomain-containing protein [Xylaria nigripes]|nr:Bromodomain-containing protein [Xylaria nigripes]
MDTINHRSLLSGRSVSPYFEVLPSRADDASYYQKIRLPLSLEIIERKLKEQQYPTLSSLESDFKRLVSNAKETHDRSHPIFCDAERLRKAVSNLMVKHNPAYKSGTYQAVPTPLPPTPGSEDEDDNDQAHDEANNDPEDYIKVEEESLSQDNADSEINADADDDDDAEAQGGREKDNTDDNADEVDEADEAVEDEENDADEVDDADEAVEDEENDADEVDEAGEEGDADEADEDEDGENEGKDDDGEPEESDDDDDSKPRRRRGSSWRQVEARSSQDSATPASKVGPRKADHYYEDVPFKGLNFQQAQEKIVEELIRKKEDSDDYPYFEPFIYLPPRTLRDYYEVITEPLSLKALQKQVRGQHGRSEATYVSDFKGWGAFEDQASLIWRNAYHYNEDGSDVFVMAQELEETFQELLKEAKENVQEPPQPKIKLKLPPVAESAGHPKRITIHVGGKNSLSGSPAPATGQSNESETARNEATRTETRRTETPTDKKPVGNASSAGTSVNLGQAEQVRSVSASAGPPSPGATGAAKAEDSGQTVPISQSQATPAAFQPSVPVAAQSSPVPNGVTQQYQQPPSQVTPPPPPPPPRRSAMDILEGQKYRPSRIKALMPKLVIITHPTLQVENQLLITIPASATEYQQEIVFNAPSSQFRLQLKPLIAPFLEREHREWKLNVMHDAMRLYPSSVSFDRRGEPIFDVTLRYGVNRLEVTLVAALPKGEKAPNGLNAEMERIVVHFNLLRH